MQIINSLSEIKTPFKNAVITIGNFDGVHLGHQALLAEAVSYARLLQGTSIAITFTPHPVDFFHHKHRPYIITPLEQKLELLAALGLDVVINIPFTKEFTQIAAADFLKRILLETIGMRAIVLGKDYSFGHNCEGNLAMLQAAAPTLGFEAILVDWVDLITPHTLRISSSAIRDMIRSAKMDEAALMLGRPFRLQGPVTHGDKRGTTILDIPTANLDITNQLYPPNGIYGGYANIDGQSYLAAIYIGAPKTFNADNVRVEAHLIDATQDLDLYGKTLKIDFIGWLRSEIKFQNPVDLKNQIIKDIEAIRQMATKD